MVDAHVSCKTVYSDSGRVHDIPRRGWLMRMKWHDLLFMHWKVDFAALRAQIPESLEIDTFDGEAWIGLVPFRMSGVSPRFVPDVPWMSRFPELNLRTYVVADDKPGVWFFSLDATNPLAVRGARSLFHLKYMDAKIDFQRKDNWIHYSSVRTHRNEPPAELKVEYRPIGKEYSTTPGTLEHWLTSRYCLYSASKSGNVYRGEIDHPEWKIRDGQAIVHTNTMTNGLGIDLPDDEPVLHFASRTDVVAWGLERVGS